MRFTRLLTETEARKLPHWLWVLEMEQLREGIEAVARVRFFPLRLIVSGLWGAIYYCAAEGEANKAREITLTNFHCVAEGGVNKAREITLTKLDRAITRDTNISRRNLAGYTVWRLITRDSDLLAMAPRCQPTSKVDVDKNIGSLEKSVLKAAPGFRDYVVRTWLCLLRALQNDEAFMAKFQPALVKVSQHINTSNFRQQSILLLEVMFNKSTHVSYTVPYSNPIFKCISAADIEGTRKILAKKEVSIFTVDPFGLSLVYYGSMYCARACGIWAAFSMFRILAELGADVSHPDEVGSTPIEILTEYAMIEWSKLGDISVLLALSRLISYERVRDIVEEHAASFRFTCIHRKLFGVDLIDSSLEQYLQSMSPHTLAGLIDEPDRHGRSPLVCAVEYGWFDAVKILVEYGADVNQRRRGDERALSILHLVFAGPLQNDTVMIAGLLISRGADVDARDADGWTPLLIASFWNNTDALPLLLDAGAVLDTRSFNGETVIDLSGDIQILEHIKAITQSKKRSC